MQISRRQVLIAMGATAAAATIGGGVLALNWWDQAPGEGLQSLSSSEYTFVQALAEAWLPPGGEPALSGAEANLGAFVDQVVAVLPEPQKNPLKLLLNALDGSTLLSHGSDFSELPLGTREQVLSGWRDHEQYLIRQAVNAVLAFVGFGWTLHPENQPKFQREYGCGYGQ